MNPIPTILRKPLARIALPALLFATPLHAETSAASGPDKVLVLAEGVSDSPEGARKALVMDAVSRVASTFTMSKQTITNDEIDAKIATFADGVVSKMTILKGPEKGVDSLYRVSGNVEVVKRNLVDTLRKEEIQISSTVRTDDLFARAVSIEALQRGSAEILEMLFEEDPRRYSARLAGEISLVPATQLTAKEAEEGGLSWMNAVVGVAANVDAYRDGYLQRLKKILDSITDEASRYQCDFGRFDSPKGYVYPLFGDASEVSPLIRNGFDGMTFGAVTDSWEPPAGTDHIYRHMFVEGRTHFAKKVASVPVFSSRAKWMLASKKRPAVGYNVMLLGLDHNAYPTLYCYGVAPAFFKPFKDLLAREGAVAGKPEQALVVTLNMLAQDGSLIKRVEHPLPRGAWTTRAFYAGRPKDDEKNERVVLMPIGLNPAFCDALQVDQRRMPSGAVMRNQNLVSSFSTVSNASVTFRFPLDPAEMRRVAEVRTRVTIGRGDGE